MDASGVEEIETGIGIEEIGGAGVEGIEEIEEVSIEGTTEDVCKGEYDDEIRICRWLNPRGIATPFYQKMGDDTILETVPFPSSNYDSYDLFRYRTRMLVFIKGLNTAYEGNYMLYEERLAAEDVMRLYLEVLDGSVTISLTEEQSAAMKEFGDRVAKYNTEHCLLFSSDLYVRNGGELLSRSKSITNLPHPREWLESMLPHIANIPELLEPIIDEGNLYVRLNRKGDYTQEYNYYHLRVLRELEEMYTLGYMALSAEEDEDFISNWQMQIVEEGLYAPKWRDLRFAPDILVFLSRRNQSNLVTIALEDNPNLVYSVAKVLSSKKGLFYVFSTLSVTFEAEDLEDIIYIADLIAAGYRSLPENVVLVPVRDRGAEARVKGSLSLYPVETVSYLTDGEDPYTLGVSLPRTVDIRTIVEELEEA